MAAKNYDFKQPLLDLDDSVVSENGKDVYMNDLLANHIRNAPITEDIVLKYFGWAIDLKKTGQLSLDEVDKDALKKFILSNNSFPTISKGRLAAVLTGDPIPPDPTKK